MAIRFTMLASGSTGNSCLVRTDRFVLLIDIGLGPRQLAAQLAAAGASWRDIDAVLLTHTHGDHWKERTLARLRQRQIPLYCHRGHQQYLHEASEEFVSLVAAGLVRTYRAGAELQLTDDLRFRPLPLSHDSGPTFGFRIEVTAGLFRQTAALGYVADLGCWTPQLADALANLDLLALEFNHDVAMQRTSGRPALLIDRVLGDAGHLSNDQAAALLTEILRRSEEGRLQHVVQLHLSRDCNHPRIARGAARAAIGTRPIAVHTAHSHRAGPCVQIGPGVTASRRRAAAPVTVTGTPRGNAGGPDR
jgi:phosphoribosyl 1,2-cyclic phosphodiesterase